MRLRANPVVGGSGCGAVGDRALPELPADIKDQLPPPQHAPEGCIGNDMHIIPKFEQLVGT